MEKMAHFFSFKTTAYHWIISSNTAIFFILLLAAFLRLYKIGDYMTFLGDEGRDVLVVYNILHGQFTLLGPTASVGGFFLGPIYYYFMAPFLWIFNYNPVGPAVMVALFGVATVWLVYKVGSDLLGKTAGLIAALLYSISPLVIAYSRSSWNPNLMPFFSILSLYIVYKGVVRKKIYLFFLTGILLGITIQLHYLAVFLGVIIAVYLFLTKSPFFQKGYLQSLEIISIVRDYFLILIGFIIGWSPFLAFEFRHGFPNLQTIVRFVLRQEGPGLEQNTGFFGTAGNIFFRLFGRFLTNFPPPEQVSLNAHFNVAVWYYATLALAFSSLVIFFLKFHKVQKKIDFQKLSLIFLWFSMGILLFGFYKRAIYDYYFGFLFPLPFLLTGNTLSFLWEKGKSLKVISASIFFILLVVNLWAMPFRFAPNRQFEQVRKIAEFVFDKTEGKPYNFALITLGNSDHAYRYFFKLWEKNPVVIQNGEIDPKRKSVTDQLLIVCEDPQCKPLGHPLWEVAGFGRAEIVGGWDVSVVKVYKLTHYKGSSL